MLLAVTDIVLLAIIAAMQAIILGAIGLVTAWVSKVSGNMQKIEHNTNSLMEAHIEATRLAGEAKGRDDERAKAIQEAAIGVIAVAAQAKVANGRIEQTMDKVETVADKVDQAVDGAMNPPKPKK